ncbi:MAG TPA: DUF3365 domain-containing protein [Saprospiraceae bacterium]|nr:DUF3365 domain-containing protein [Saprospiraceae bacterium]HPQ22271.1 DUF3365 domain-containing protein [Saprospiraceae bacterium]
MIKFLILAMTLTVAISCNSNNKKPVDNSQPIAESLGDEGFDIIKQNCIQCHANNNTFTKMIAPPLAAVKEHYLENVDNEADFVKNMSDFLVSPNIMNSRMPNAVEKFGIMPTLGYDRNQYEAIARYIYNAELEKPDWLEKHEAESKSNMIKNSDPSNIDFLKEGKNIALSTKSILGKNLLNAIQTKGTPSALEFCNTRAIPLTDSMAVALNANIKRVSDKNRNPNNAANEEELKYIAKVKTEVANGENPSPKAIESGDKVIAYYPIMTNKMCLQCHGNTNDDISVETQSSIKKLYPHDLATGYKENELRGIWVVTMDRKE